MKFNVRATIQNLKRTRMFSFSLEIHVPNKLGCCSPCTIGEQEPCCRTKLPLGGKPHHHPLRIFDIADSVLHKKRDDLVEFNILTEKFWLPTQLEEDDFRRMYNVNQGPSGHSSNEDLKVAYYGQLTKAQMDRVYQFFMPDYLLFGYEKDTFYNYAKDAWGNHAIYLELKSDFSTDSVFSSRDSWILT